MAAKCSVIGIGTDIGGSIRLPAAFSGSYSYKPSTRRMCISGMRVLHVAWEGNMNLVVTNGPMGRCVNDLSTMMKVLLKEEVYKQAPLEAKDIYFNPRSWDEKLYENKPKLRIGFFKSLRITPASEAN